MFTSWSTKSAVDFPVIVSLCRNLPVYWWWLMSRIKTSSNSLNKGNKLELACNCSQSLKPTGYFTGHIYLFHCSAILWLLFFEKQLSLRRLEIEGKYKYPMFLEVTNDCTVNKPVNVHMSQHFNIVTETVLFEYCTNMLIMYGFSFKREHNWLKCVTTISMQTFIGTHSRKLIYILFV